MTDAARFGVKFNLAFCLFHVVSGFLVFMMGIFPWIPLVMLPVNGALVAYFCLRHEPQPVAIEPKPKDTYCSMWEIRNTQRKMIDAGIIKYTDISVCDNEDCSDCKVTRETIENERYHRQRNVSDEWRDRLREEMIATRALSSGSTSMPRTKEVDGQTFVIPLGVPAHAKATVYYDHLTLSDSIMWEWHTKFGERRAKVQRFSPESLDLLSTNNLREQQRMVNKYSDEFPIRRSECCYCGVQLHLRRPTQGKIICLNCQKKYAWHDQPIARFYEDEYQEIADFYSDEKYYDQPSDYDG